MTAASYGPIISNISGNNAFAVLANGQIVVIQATDAPTLTATFYGTDGTLLAGPVILGLSGSPSFAYGINSIAPHVVALPSGGFAVLGQANSNGVSTDYVASFDAQGNIVNNWTVADTHVDPGNNALIALSNGGTYVSWNTDANDGTNFSPLLAGYPAGQSNQAGEGTDVAGATLSPAGQVTSAITYNTGTLTDLSKNLPFNGLAGNQNLGQAAQLTSGTIVQSYLDTVYYASGDKAGYLVDPADAVSFSLGGGPRILVYAQGNIPNDPKNGGYSSTSGLPSDLTSGTQAVALTNGTFAVFYTLDDDSTPARAHDTYAAFYNADGSSAGAQVLVLQRFEYNSGNDNYAGGGPDVVALPSGGFAMAYFSEPTVNNPTAVFQVSLFTATGTLTETIPVPSFPLSGATNAISVGADGSLYVEDDSSNIYAIVGTAPGDFAANDSADTTAETLSATSTTRNYILAGSGATTILGGSGADTLQGGSGGDVFELQASAAVVVSKGADTIVGSAGSATIQSSGAALYFGASGPALFNALGTSATLVGGGTETINAGAANMLVFGGSGGLLFNAGGGASTVVSGSGGATINGGTTGLLYFGTGPTTYNPGTAVDTVIGFTGTLTATGGANGTLFFTGTGGNNSVSSGAGSSTIFGFGANDGLVATGAGNDVIATTAAAETVFGAQSTGTNTFFAFGANDVLVGGSGSTALESGLGNHTLIAGSGSTLFDILNSGVRSLTLENFNAAQDFVQLQGYAAGAGATALQTATVSGGSEILTLVDGTTVTFQGATNLTSSSFISLTGSAI